MKGFAQLSRARKIAVLASTFFVVLHVGTVLSKGLRPQIREPIWPALSWYGDGLRMANSWGMFARPHTHEALFSVGISESGQRTPIYPQPKADESLYQRVRDARVRKLQSNLKRIGKGNRWQEDYADYLCRTAAVSSPYQFVVLETADGPEREKFPRKVIHQHRCKKSGVKR